MNLICYYRRTSCVLYVRNNCRFKISLIVFVPTERQFLINIGLK
jgi:hypothetical protein